MARPRKPEPQPTSLVSSAVRMPTVREGSVRSAEAWQGEVWRLYDLVPELRFSANWVANMMSRATLTAVKQVANANTPITSGPVYDVLTEYFGTEDGQSEMLRKTGLHLHVAGECYHVYRDSDQTWHVLAAGKVKQVGKGSKAKLRADFGDEHGMTDVTKGKDLVIRVWNPHPNDPQRADSPMRANLSTLHEIERSSQSVSATLKSRLAGAGLLMLPSDMTFPAPDNAPEGASQADLFMLTLGDAMLTPISDPEDASAVVPIVVTAPGDDIGKARHLTFAGEVSEQVRLIRDNAIRRFALGVDIPPEVLMGMGDTNHWNAWLSDESSIKAHIEPRLSLVAHAITDAYLRIVLRGMGDIDGTPDDYAVMADTASIRIRPNRSREALDLWDRGELTPEALRRETGFFPEDKPTRNEMQEWLLRKIALGSTSPEQTQAAVEMLGIGLDTPEHDALPKGRPDDLDPRRTVERDARDKGPVPEPLLAAGEVLVFRALERAGNRLRSKHSYRGQTAPVDLYLEFDGDPDFLLADAFTCVDRVASDAPGDFALRLDSYCRGLLATKTPHSREALAAHLGVIRAVS